MTPLIQTRIAKTQASAGGNCLAACYCAIIDRPELLEPLSDAMEPAKTSDMQRVFANKFLQPLGWTVLTLINFDDGEEQMSGPSVAPLIHVATGMGPRGMHHAIVRMADGSFHDPHPSGGGLHEHINRFDVLVKLTRGE